MNIFKNHISHNDIDIILKYYNFGNQNNDVISYHSKSFEKIVHLKEIFYKTHHMLQWILR